MHTVDSNDILNCPNILGTGENIVMAFNGSLIFSGPKERIERISGKHRYKMSQTRLARFDYVVIYFSMRSSFAFAFFLIFQ